MNLKIEFVGATSSGVPAGSVAGFGASPKPLQERSAAEGEPVCATLTMTKMEVIFVEQTGTPGGEKVSCYSLFVGTNSLRELSAGWQTYMQ